MDTLSELRVLIARHVERPSHRSQLPRLLLASSSRVGGPVPHVWSSMLGLVVQGARRMVLGSQAFDYAAGELVVLSVKAPITTQITRASAREPFLAVGLVIEPKLVSSLLLTAAEPRSRVAPRAVATTKASTELLDAFYRFLRLLDAPQDIAVLSEAIEREILWRVMQSEQGALLRDIGLANSALTRIGGAIELLHKRFAEPLRVEALARTAHMSVATFNRQFRKATAMSPLQFQKRLRLQEARIQLLTRASDVRSISLAVGYQSPSQFSREYRRLFGQPPSSVA